ncbi:NfeD family protein [candidate division WOR-3 bacterium]|uniref:NfeD family protein n=1 Tax=candidate division WOR-3 bacterium TaxID=2052148 RepID=A0A938BT57_UNCW3|nr:NfeD family protein [candidate division WOR-3 bacterium]
MFQLTPAVWIIAGLILAALEMVVPGFVIIWFGVAGVITGILAIFVYNSYIQFGVFVVLSSLMVVFSQRIARRITHAEPEPVGANRWVGMGGRVIADIRPPELGRVKVRGEEWRATAQCELPTGATVRVVAVDGTHLVVEPEKEGSC